MYALLGLPKKIGKLLFYENLIIGVTVLIIGIMIGTLLSKLFAMILIKLLGMPVQVGMAFSLRALVHTLIVFMVIILATSIQGYRLIYSYKLIELFRAEQKGSRNRKRRFYRRWVQFSVWLRDTDSLSAIFPSPKKFL